MIRNLIPAVWRMIGLRVEIRRFVDESQPGWVECQLIDTQGCEWLFVEKVPIVSTHNLDSTSDYPQSGIIACQIIAEKTGDDGQRVILVDTEQPWGIHSISGETRFEILPNQLEEFDSNGCQLQPS